VVPLHTANVAKCWGRDVGLSGGVSHLSGDRRTAIQSAGGVNGWQAGEKAKSLQGKIFLR
jgi:hypothetical protein